MSYVLFDPRPHRLRVLGHVTKLLLEKLGKMFPSHFNVRKRCVSKSRISLRPGMGPVLEVGWARRTDVVNQGQVSHSFIHSFIQGRKEGKGK